MMDREKTAAAFRLLLFASVCLLALSGTKAAEGPGGTCSDTASIGCSGLVTSQCDPAIAAGCSLLVTGGSCVEGTTNYLYEQPACDDGDPLSGCSSGVQCHPASWYCFGGGNCCEGRLYNTCFSADSLCASVSPCSYSGGVFSCTGTFSGSCSSYNNRQTLCQNLGCTWTSGGVGSLCTEEDMTCNSDYGGAGDMSCCDYVPFCTKLNGVGRSMCKACIYDNDPTRPCTSDFECCSPSTCNTQNRIEGSVVGTWPTAPTSVGGTDYIVSKIVAPENVTLSTRFNVTVTIHNKGDQKCIPGAGCPLNCPSCGNTMVEVTVGDCYTRRKVYNVAINPGENDTVTLEAYNCTTPGMKLITAIPDWGNNIDEVNDMDEMTLMGVRAVAPVGICGGSPNHPPNAPDAPVIAAASPPLTTLGTASCTSNCPPSTLPADQEGDAVTMSYLWYIDTTPVGSWSSSAGSLNCMIVTCPLGSSVTLHSQACDPSFACSESISNILTVQAAAVCNNDGNCDPGETTANCPADCPPAPICNNNGACDAGETHANCPTDCIYSPPIGSAGDWSIYLWTFFAVLISSSFIALAYMASKLFELPVLDAWVKIELHELVSSMLIAVFCVGLIATVNSASQFLVGESGATSIISVSQSFMRDSVYADGRFIYKKLGEAYFNAAKTASYSYTAGTSIGLASFSYSQSPASGMSPLVAEVGQAMDSVSSFMLLAAAQFSFLNFFGTAVAIMLPAGIFLRSFSFTRKIGGVVLAAAIAAAVLYPSTFLVSREIYNIYRVEMMTGANDIRVTPATNPPLADLVCSPYMQAFTQSPLGIGELGWWITICTVPCALTLGGFAACMKGCYDVTTTIYFIITTVFKILWAPIFVSAGGGAATPAQLLSGYHEPLMKYALPAVAKYAVLSLTVFLIPLMMTMTMLRNLAITFGGEPQLYGISKLV